MGMGQKAKAKIFPSFPNHRFDSLDGQFRLQSGQGMLRALHEVLGAVRWGLHRRVFGCCHYAGGLWMRMVGLEALESYMGGNGKGRTKDMRSLMTQA